MPNMIHSMDAANIHILLDSLIKAGHNIPIYTIHDCFATTANNMPLLNDFTIAAFMEMYLESNYLEKFHRNIIEQIDSYGLTELKLQEGGRCYISGDVVHVIPEFPKEFVERWEKNKGIFIQGLKRSEYFIS